METQERVIESLREENVELRRYREYANAMEQKVATLNAEVSTLKEKVRQLTALVKDLEEKRMMLQGWMEA